MIGIDIETTGLSRKDCGICQISLIKIDKDLNIIDKYDTYVKPRPDAVWNDGAMNCSGITPEMVKNSPSIKEIAPTILEFIGDEDILTYNGNTFDIPFLQEELKREGYDLIISNRKLYDSMYIESQINSRKLGAVYERYVGKTMEENGLDPHNSLSDIQATLEVFKAQKNLVNVEDLVSSNSFGGVIGKDGDHDIFLIGKYRGTPVITVIKKDPDWVAWLIKQKKDSDFFNYIKKMYNNV